MDTVDTAPARPVRVVTQNGDTYEIGTSVAPRSGLIKDMLQDLGETDVPIPIPNVASHVLDIIIEWCRARSEPEPLAEDLQENDARAQPLPAADVDFFSKHMDRRYDLILAANYLHIESLIDAGCRFDAMNLQGKTTQEMCTYLKIKSDFTPEEMAANAREDEALLNPDAAPLEASSSTAQTV